MASPLRRALGALPLLLALGWASPGLAAQNCTAAQRQAEALLDAAMQGRAPLAQAAAAFEALLAGGVEPCPDRAGLLESLADALTSLGLERMEPALLRRAILSYEEALALTPPEEARRRAQRHNSQGTAQALLGEITGDAAALEAARASFEASLPLFTRLGLRGEEAAARRNLGHAFTALGLLRGDAALLRQGAGAYRATLALRPGRDTGAVQGERAEALLAAARLEHSPALLREALAARDAERRARRRAADAEGLALSWQGRAHILILLGLWQAAEPAPQPWRARLPWQAHWQAARVALFQAMTSLMAAEEPSPALMRRLLAESAWISQRLGAVERNPFLLAEALRVYALLRDGPEGKGPEGKGPEGKSHPALLCEEAQAQARLGLITPGTRHLREADRLFPACDAPEAVAVAGRFHAGPQDAPPDEDIPALRAAAARELALREQAARGGARREARAVVR
ncbi:hypothetical protein NON00_22940 [Roseomonas sp. GC11]|uniref:hypothetical protein n=1 Tax=Roseomonas sp. GC11 TaxID=2950546 RepID=UPI00210F0D2D|nr:hypothetical protein [Roseomonas sp. GC11]MCQ4162766.1 hypothetical protein [Roseomonas sp. GC11]